MHCRALSEAAPFLMLSLPDTAPTASVLAHSPSGHRPCIQAGIERDFSVLLWADFYPLDSKAILHHLPFSCIFFFL